VKRDPIEETEEFIEVLKRIQPQLDAIDRELDELGYGI
jgi:DNA-binding FrmR family transcriptional regulator